MKTIVETQKKVIDKQLYNYIISKIELNDELTQMTVYVRDAKYVKTIKTRMERTLKVSGLDESSTIEFSGVFASNDSKVMFTGNIQQAIQFLLAYESISYKTFQNVESFFLKNKNVYSCIMM